MVASILEHPYKLVDACVSSKKPVLIISWLESRNDKRNIVHRIRIRKMVSVSVRYLFYQPIGEKIKTWRLRFPAKENPTIEKALFD